MVKVLNIGFRSFFFFFFTIDTSAFESNDESVKTFNFSSLYINQPA